MQDFWLCWISREFLRILSALLSAHRPDDYADRRLVVTQTTIRGVQMGNWSDKNKSCLVSHSWLWSEQWGLNIKPCGLLCLASIAFHISLTISLKYCYCSLTLETSRKRKPRMGLKLNKYSTVSLHTKKNVDCCLSVPVDVKWHVTSLQLHCHLPRTPVISENWHFWRNGHCSLPLCFLNISGKPVTQRRLASGNHNSTHSLCPLCTEYCVSFLGFGNMAVSPVGFI